MKRYLISCALAASAFTQTAMANDGEITSLKDLLWENRIIVANSENDSEDLTDLFSQANHGIIDRDVIWFVLSNNELQTNYKGATSPNLLSQIRNQYPLSDNEVILIGKDGGLKERISGLDLERLFGDIDHMPMRIREMREKQSGQNEP